MSRIPSKQICLQTIIYLIVLSVGVAIGYTNFVQAELKEDVGRIEKNQEISTAKINSIQIQLVEIAQDVKNLAKNP